MDELRALTGDNCCAIMCGEAAWWRCHRRVIADYLLAEGVPVSHITGMNKIDSAKFTPGVRLLHGGTLVYPAVEEETVNDRLPLLWLTHIAYRRRRVCDDQVGPGFSAWPRSIVALWFARAGIDKH